jgi:predicted Ser/Thr protein kinase
VCNKAKLTLRKMLNEHGYSEKAADELWKWYDFYEKKGVASF